MKTKHIIILLFSITATIFALLTACEKLDPEIPEGEGSYKEGSLPEISVGDATGIDYTSASVPVTVLATGGRKITRLALCYSSLTGNPTIEDQVVELGEVNIEENNLTFEANLTDLTHNTQYNYRAFAINMEGEAYSSSKSFSTLLDDRRPQVATEEATQITATSAVLNGRLTNMGEATSISQHGFVWATHSNPELNDNKIELGTLNAAPADFNSTIENLNINTTYYFRAYAVNSYGTTLGSVVTFSTLSGEISLTTADITNITATSATGGGNIADDGGLEVTARGVCWSTSSNPTLSNSYTTDGVGTGSFTSELTGLTESTTYFVRAYATNETGTYYGEEKSFVAELAVTDIDGNTYSAVQIGNQIWMAENLKTTTYNNGTSIDLVTDNTAWENNTTGAYSWYDNDQTQYAETYGALYNWYAVNTGNLCPDGWHVPTDAEWTALENYIASDGHSGSEGTALRATYGWNDNGNGTDDYGFSALPGGLRNYVGAFRHIGFNGFWWSATESATNSVWGWVLTYNYSILYRFDYGKENGFSVRCLRD